MAQRPSSRIAAKNQPSSEAERIAAEVGDWLGWAAFQLMRVGVIWAGYDLFAPLFHLPLANPLHVLGLLAAIEVARRGSR